MDTKSLLVLLDAKPGKEAEVESFLRSGLDIVEKEPATTTWFALRLGPSRFAIFDTFPDESGRQAHLAGQVAAALRAKGEDLFARPPSIEPIDIIAEKLPA
jgi:quinol monooxygenase YgiN